MNSRFIAEKGKWKESAPAGRGEEKRLSEDEAA